MAGRNDLNLLHMPPDILGLILAKISVVDELQVLPVCLQELELIIRIHDAPTVTKATAHCSYMYCGT